MAGTYVSRSLCSEVVRAGRTVLESGFNPRFTCEDKNYQKLLDSGMDMKSAMRKLSVFSANAEASDREKYVLICDILDEAKKLTAAGINPEFILEG